MATAHLALLPGSKLMRECGNRTLAVVILIAAAVLAEAVKASATLTALSLPTARAEPECAGLARPAQLGTAGILRVVRSSRGASRRGSHRCTPIRTARR